MKKIMEKQAFFGEVTINDDNPRLIDLIKDLDAMGAQVHSDNMPAAVKAVNKIANRLNILPVLVLQAGYRQCVEGKRPWAARYLLGLSDMVRAIREQLAADPDCGPAEALAITYALMKEIARQDRNSKGGLE